MSALTNAWKKYAPLNNKALQKKHANKIGENSGLVSFLFPVKQEGGRPS